MAPAEDWRAVDEDLAMSLTRRVSLTKSYLGLPLGMFWLYSMLRGGLRVALWENAAVGE